MNITLSQLEYIIAVDRYRHFQTAADHCYVTQPTLSMQIKKLEINLGVILFDRSRHPVQTTPIGSQIVALAKECVESAKRIIELAEDDTAPTSGELTAGIIPTIGPYLLPRITKLLSQKSDVHFHFREMLTSEAIEQVRAGSIDAAILSTPVEERGIETIVLYYEPLCVYCAPGNALLNEPVVYADKLDIKTLWLLSEGHCFRNQVLQICQRHQPDSSRYFTYTTGSLEALIKLLQQHEGYTILPHLAALDIEPGKIGYLRRFAEPIPNREVSIVVKSGFSKRRLIHLLREIIVNSMPAGLMLEPTGDVLSWNNKKT